MTDRATDRKRSDDGRPPCREVDVEQPGERAKTPPGIIRRPIRLPEMARVKR